MRPIHTRTTLATGLFLSLALIVLVGARYQPSGAPGSEGVSGASLRLCEVTCLMETCGSDWDEHKAPGEGHLDNGYPHGPHDDCDSEACGWYTDRPMHPQCLEFAKLKTSGDYERLKVALTKSDPRSIQRILNRHPKALVVNAERQSLQVLGCDGLPLANHPMNSTLYERLVAAQ